MTLPTFFEKFDQFADAPDAVAKPFHPEVEGADFELKEGMQNPFVTMADKQGRPFVPIYSCEERVDESFARGKVPVRQYSAGAMPAQQLLQILGHLKVHASLNYFCETTGQVLLPPDLMRDLADGSALTPQPLDDPKPESHKLDIVDPEDYPASMVQPLFETLKKHRNFRVAWLFRVPGGPLPSGGHHYKLLIVMDPRDNTILHDIEIVMAAVPKDGNVISSGLLDEKDAGMIAGLFRQAVPIFVAPDFERPPGSKE